MMATMTLFVLIKRLYFSFQLQKILFFWGPIRVSLSMKQKYLKKWKKQKNSAGQNLGESSSRKKFRRSPDIRRKKIWLELSPKFCPAEIFGS